MPTIAAINHKMYCASIAFIAPVTQDHHGVHLHHLLFIVIKPGRTPDLFCMVLSPLPLILNLLTK